MLDTGIVNMGVHLYGHTLGRNQKKEFVSETTSICHRDRLKHWYFLRLLKFVKSLTLLSPKPYMEKFI